MNELNKKERLFDIYVGDVLMYLCLNHKEVLDYIKLIYRSYPKGTSIQIEELPYEE